MKRFKSYYLKSLSVSSRLFMLLLLMCHSQLMRAYNWEDDTFVYDGIHYRIAEYSSGKYANVIVINASHQYDELGNIILVSEGYSGHVVIPDAFYYKDILINSTDEIPYSVVGIDEYAFYKCSSLESVSIPESIRSIRGCAFQGCTNLIEIALPTNIDYMDESVFEGCTNLMAVTLPRQFNWYDDCYIPRRTFYGCTNLKDVKMPPYVSLIEEEAFEGCESLPTELFYRGTGKDGEDDKDDDKKDDDATSEELLLEHVGRIGQRAFARCNGIKSLTLPSNLIQVDFEAFAECENLTEVTLDMKEIITHFEPIFKGCNNLKRISIGANVERIQVGSLTPRGVEEVHIPDIATWLNIQFIEGNPFWGEIMLGDDWGMRQQYSLYISNKKLTNLIIPDGIEHIGDYAFDSCEGLTSVTIPNTMTYIGQQAFKDCYDITDINLPNSITTIGAEAFSGCENLSNITLSENIRSISSYTFWACISLTSIEIPSGVTEIGSNAFGECYNLTSIEIPNTVTTIDDHAFWTCYNLPKITIPSSVTEIGSLAFNGCGALMEIHSQNTTPPNIYRNSYSATFDELTEQKATLYVPKGCVPIYSEHPYWGRFATILEEGTSSIEEVTSTSSESIETIYTLDGRKWNVDSFSILPNGIYIINGKKTIIK